MKSSLILIITLFAITFLTSSSFCQEDSLSQNKVHGINYNGDWAFQIEMSKYPGFTDTRDLSIGGYKYLTSSSAARAGITFIGLLDKVYNYSDYTNTYSNTSFSFNSYSEKITGTEIFAQYLFYPVNEKVINLFMGGGPVLLFWNKDINRTTNIIDQSTYSRQYAYGNDKVWSAGLCFSFGVQWFPTKRMGIVAEYNALVVNSHHSSNTTYQDDSMPPVMSQENVTRNVFQLTFSDVRVGFIVNI